MPVPQPDIVQFQAHPLNINVRPVGIAYEGLVVHTTAGGSTLEALGSWFGGGNIAAGLRGSTHFGVDRAGRIGQYVRLDQQPIAHGAERGSTATILQGNEGISTNAYLIGVEHLDAGTPGSVTTEQLVASAHLMAWLWESVIAPKSGQTGAALDLDHLLQHKDLAPSSRPNCASWTAQRMSQHLDRIKAMLAPPPPADPRDERIRLLEASKAGLRDGYTLTTKSVEDELATQLMEMRNHEARLREMIGKARQTIAKHGA